MSIWRRKGPELTEHADVLSACELVNAYAAGLRTVPIDCLTGTEDRSSDFDAHFEPRKHAIAESVERVRRAFPEGDVPAIDVVATETDCFVRDGHKRVSAARRAGAEYVDADITRLHVTCPDGHPAPAE
jgi:hypothetical protein